MEVIIFNAVFTGSQFLPHFCQLKLFLTNEALKKAMIGVSWQIQYLVSTLASFNCFLTTLNSYILSTLASLAFAVYNFLTYRHFSNIGYKVNFSFNTIINTVRTVWYSYSFLHLCRERGIWLIKFRNCPHTVYLCVSDLGKYILHLNN